MKHKHVRVTVPNTVYLTNLPQSLTSECLSRPEFLGMYGRLEKVVVHKNKSAHINYFSPSSATLCMKFLNNFYYDGNVITAQEGTTKYADDINHKALRVADINEPIRPVPKSPVFPLPRTYLMGRPSTLGDFYVGTGTLVDKTWAGTSDRLSPGSITCFKRGFVPKIPALPLHLLRGGTSDSGASASMEADPEAEAMQVHWPDLGVRSARCDSMDTDVEEDDDTPRGVADLDDDDATIGSCGSMYSQASCGLGFTSQAPPGLCSGADTFSASAAPWNPRATAPARLMKTAVHENNWNILGSPPRTSSVSCAPAPSGRGATTWLSLPAFSAGFTLVHPPKRNNHGNNENLANAYEPTPPWRHKP